MAIPSSYPLYLTNDPLVDVSTTGYLWNVGSSRTINWSISNGFSGEFWYNPPHLVQQLDSIFKVFSTYININFNYTGFFEKPTNAYNSGSDINVSWDYNNIFYNNYSTWALGFFPVSASNYQVYPGAPGDIFLNLKSEANYLESYAPGSAGWFLLLHEIGHTLGLKHTHDSGGTGRPTMNDIGLPSYDTDWISMMSYEDDYDYNKVAFDPSTPMVLDVIGLQYLYGANLSTNSGDSVFSLFKQSTYVTIWDPSGNDTVDASSSTVAWAINLPEYVGVHSIGDARPKSEINLSSPLNFYWLMGDIENAIGSQYNDIITGNSLNNHLTGGDGSDLLDGGTGIDTAYYSGNLSDYFITTQGSTTFVSNFNGLDELINIERIATDNGHLALDLAGNAGQAYRLYKAAFDRIPDTTGLGYWINTMDNGASINSVANAFLLSAEFENLYGQNSSTDTFIYALYNNVLNRSPDDGGFLYWQNILSSEIDTRSGVLIGFSESTENKDNVVNLISNGITYDFWG